MGIGKRIKEARERLGLTQNELGELVGVTGSAITNYEKETSHPKEPVMYKLIEVLKVDANFLFQDVVRIPKKVNDVTFSEYNLIKKYRALDGHGKEVVDVVLDKETERMQSLAEQAEDDDDDNVIDVDFSSLKASAGNGFDLFDDAPTDKLRLVLNNTTRQADICIRVDGHSMEPVFNNGDILLVRNQPSVNVGEYGIYVINNEGYVKKQGTDRLISVNDEYDDIYPSEYDNVRCCGKVIGVLDTDWIVE